MLAAPAGPGYAWLVSDSEQTELLRAIWNEMKALGQNLGGRLDALRTELGARIDQTNARLDQTNARLAGAEDRLGAIEGVLRDLGAQQVLLGRYVKNVVDRHEVSLDEFRERLARLEGPAGGPR